MDTGIILKRLRWHGKSPLRGPVPIFSKRPVSTQLLSEKLTWLTMLYMYGEMHYHKKITSQGGGGVSESVQNQVHTID